MQEQKKSVVSAVCPPRYHSEVRQEAVQQALAALHDKPKQLVPMASKRASVAQPRPTSSTHGDDDLTSSEEEGVEEEGREEGVVVCETRNLALGLSDTSSTSSLASGPTRYCTRPGKVAGILQ